MENFLLSLSGLSTIAQRSGGELNKFLSKQIWSPQDREAILNILAQLLLDKECTLLIGRQLRPLLLDLLERNEELIKAGGQINHDLHERLCVAMSKLVNSYPDVLPFSLRYFQNASPVFQRLFLESCDSGSVRYGRRRMKLRDLMEAAYRFLKQDTSSFREMWDWSVCVPLLKSHDLTVRWYTAHCLSLVTCMSDINRQIFLKKMFSADELIYFKLQFLDELQILNIEKGLLMANSEKSTWQKDKSQTYTQGYIVSGDLCQSVVPVCGVILAKKHHKGQHGVKCKMEKNINQLVLVESTCTNLHSLALAVSYQNPVLLEGPIGCGKTALVEYLAAITGRKQPPDILKVQLGDQTDSKMLLGMYRCTDIPGEFVWQPGSLTQAIANGHWILLEDIDYAPLDVISVLIPVLENGELLIPGRGDCIKVGPGFQLFATRRLLSSSAGAWYRPQNSHATLLDKYWTKIHLGNMSQEELKEVLQTLHPNLNLAIDRLLDIYIQLTGDKHLALPALEKETESTEDQKQGDKRYNLEGRGLSLRDLLKWCNRISPTFDSTSSSTALNIFYEALDCFTAMLSKPESRLRMAEAIGSKLNISKQKAEFYCYLYKPEIAVRDLDVTVGRVEILRKQIETLHLHREKNNFAATRPSSVLIEQLAVCVHKGEPVLLVGETGTGKTSTVQYLAHVAGQRLRVVNMNQQSDAADLLGGYKPVDHKLIWLPLRENFEELFSHTFSRKQNITFLGHVQTCYRHKRWQDLLKLMQHVLKSALNKVHSGDTEHLLKEKWEGFSLRLNQAQQQMRMTENALLFAFVEGTLAQAVKKGDWILLDEINLAAAETLECMCGLLEGSSESLVLLDRGDTEPLIRHPDFRLFACMNPATDVGKRNLPPGIRNSFYLAIRKKCNSDLVDGTGHRPHYSLRTLCRALRYASANPCSNIQRSLYEGFCLGFLTQLDRASHSVVQGLICRYIVQGNIKNMIKQPLPEPQGGRFVQIEGYWIPVGDKEPAIDETYILTTSVNLNLRDLGRVVSAGSHPVLIQGETSVGKTSLIKWLACASGNHCVRINNHEHTDIQEYIGCYTSDASGRLIFKEGVLIDAMRKGYWIILDELNLAPTDVLEALNRLLDDNRELFITETQEVVKAHARFMLFATQNPPGLYGGRKVLSRAFRNRFVELHFDELPSAELETILHKRCSLPPSYCNKLVAVMLELQSHRRGSSVFAGKHGFITLRDLFRWAERYRLSEQTVRDYDWLQHLANDGFMLLAGRVRKQEEEEVILKVIKKCFKKEVNPQNIFSRENVQKQLDHLSVQQDALDFRFSHIVWTQGMRRLAVLVGRALQFGEPVLLVGDTGCGKTTICQLFAALANQPFHYVNCHQHMETSDFLGGLRPVRQRSREKDDGECSKLFEWYDGPLVLAMKEEGFFLMDEISLADDSVLERLNSVLEVEKILVLAEKGSGEDENEVEILTAGNKFRILATMNPGGDFGKKELSPALRNRFTEIWSPQSADRQDLTEIIRHNLHAGLSLGAADYNGADVAEVVMDFIEWLINQDFGRRCILSVRDILSWVNFMNVMIGDKEMVNSMVPRCNLDSVTAVIHGACLVYIDGIGSGTTFCSAESTLLARQKCMRFLSEKLSENVDLNEHTRSELKLYDKDAERIIYWKDTCFGIHPFYIPIGPFFEGGSMHDYALGAETTSLNAQRLLRALQLNKPILLEGSPGVGKTSLVTALAKASGNCLVRINLSEQTDVTDLFGTDLPIEGGKGGEFAWRDGPLLSALKAGYWIVLDELNLASQSVLEGLNACFDHRGEVYIPELGVSFQVQHEKTKIFGCQNPFHQGGGRKGLPRSFLNRFTQVYVDQLSYEDMEFIANSLFPAIDKSTIAKMVTFNNQIDLQVMVERKWGQKGGPWEFNLRDLFRWCQLMVEDQSLYGYDPSQHVFLIYGERMRTKKDREKVISIYKEVFGDDLTPYMGTREFHITPQNVQVGYSLLTRNCDSPSSLNEHLSLLHHSLQYLEPVMKCVQMGWMVILVGPASAGKTSLVQLLSLLTGHKLKVMAMNSAMDTTELLGGFEQTDINRPWQQLMEQVGNAVTTLVKDSLLAADTCPEEPEMLLRLWSTLSLIHKPKFVGEGGRGITTDLLNKLEGVLSQIQKMNFKLNSFSRREFVVLVEHFNNFKEQLLHSVEGQSSGTFEWVDGMLVQALQSGDWLLMDNVNFCSSSVLDRLNALLEPGGVLSMTERGVIDGSTITITPHPNFRLFLTMDPSHGEISRAMRNRGIELYISGESDGVLLDSFDTKSILHGLGVVGDTTCDALIEVHSEIKEALTGSPCDSLSTLLRAATLISQQLQRGIGLEKAFYTACKETFMFSHHSLTSQKNAHDILQNKITAVASTNEGSLLSLGMWPDSVPSALLCTEDSVMSTILRDGQLLVCALNRQSLLHNRLLPLTLQDLQRTSKAAPGDNLQFIAITLDSHWMDHPLVIAHSVQLVTEKASASDWTMRMRWLSHLAKKLAPDIDHVRSTVDAGAYSLSRVYSSPLPNEMCSVIKLLEATISEDCIPLDPRWNMQYLEIATNTLSFDTGAESVNQMLQMLNSVANRAMLLLDREKQLFTEKHWVKELKETCALKIAAEFHKDPSVNQAIPHPLVAHLTAFFDLWDTYVCECLQSNHSTLTNDSASEVLECIVWRDRFIKVCANATLDPAGLALIALHWGWIVKYTLKQIPPIFIRPENNRLFQEVRSVTTSIQECLIPDSQGNTNVKLLQNVLGRPLPFKDFVKISRWNDVTFWSVKQSVEKTHRTLFKYTKKFETALSEACGPALVETVHEEQLDFCEDQRECLAKRNHIQQILVLRTALMKEEEALAENIYSADYLLSRLPLLTKRMRKLCSKLMKNSQMPSFFDNLDDFAEGIIVSVKELQNLSVDKDAEKEKQKSQAKHILMQKQRALSELFKMLSKSGLSYRKGLVFTRTKSLQDVLCLHPLDLHNALAISYSSALETDSEVLDDISLTWNGCQKYFYRSIARSCRLETALLAPTKEVGLGNIERCKGFSGHLLKILVKQRSSLTVLTEQWMIMRNLLNCIQEISLRMGDANDYQIAFPPQDGVQQWVERLQHLTMQCTMILEQLLWFIDCCPVQEISSTNIKQKMGDNIDTIKPEVLVSNKYLLFAEGSCPSPVCSTLLPPASAMRKSDPAWQQLSSTVTKRLTEIKEKKNEIYKIRQKSCETPFYAWSDFEACSSALDTMQDIAIELREVESMFVPPETDVKDTVQHITFLKSLHYIREEIRTAMREFTLWKSRLQAMGRAKRNQESDVQYIKDFSNKVESTIKSVLCAVQSLVEKKRENEFKETVTEEGGEECSEDRLPQNLITRLLTEDMCSDLKALRLQNIISSVSELVERLKSYGEDCIKDKHMFFNQCCGLLVRLFPMLSSYSDLILFYLSLSLATHRSTGKLLCILAQLFTELAQKGFCLPKELIEEAVGDGATEFHDYEGGGIGEGDGMKDVSDKIENEDQIEDTVKKDQENNKDNADCKPDVKEEDNAIEMSEDIDGKMHDGELEKQEEDDKSDSDEELDKQMGDLGDAETDKLDERLWGEEDDDDDDDENEEEKDKAEETGPGMDMGESELVAKDDNMDTSKEDKNRHPKDEKEEEMEDALNKEKIHEQMDERDYDENEIDPYHGKQEQQLESEVLDLPDDLNLENDEEKNSGDEKEEESEERNPYDIEEESVNMESNDQLNEEADAGNPEEEKDEENSEKKESEDTSGQEKDAKEIEELDEEQNNKDNEDLKQSEDDGQKDSDQKDKENVLPTDEGTTPKGEEETSNIDNIPDSAEKMEHETSGQTAEENLQSETAAELAGTASEKDESKEDHGTGTADANQSEGHQSKLMARLTSQNESIQSTKSVKRKPGHTDDERSVGDQNEQIHKRLRIMDSSCEMTDSPKMPEHKSQNADAYEHIKQESVSYDTQTYDAASKEQEKTMQPLNKESVENNLHENSEMEVEQQTEEILQKAIDVEQLRPEELNASQTRGFDFLPTFI
ncbi:hypothetical protein GDO86_009802 [Hymenochirus boettgeri]|uniref:Midasin n=1 Tax=Hymenochirus boettgeri TaxID=247094 RepID=A0A8T2JQT9_9PIPI|nr:hypothetical protein GDO86_009802 [Hymenochirus boettgeri]